MRSRVLLVSGLLVVVTLLQGCASMGHYEKVRYRELKRELDVAGLPVMEEKDPILAGALNLLPGIGNAYLEQWGPFVANLLFWPISAVWAVPQAVIDANTINKKETIYFYEYGPGKSRLAATKTATEPQATVVSPTNPDVAP